MKHSEGGRGLGSVVAFCEVLFFPIAKQLLDLLSEDVSAGTKGVVIVVVMVI